MPAHFTNRVSKSFANVLMALTPVAVMATMVATLNGLFV